MATGTTLLFSLHWERNWAHCLQRYIGVLYFPSLLAAIWKKITAWLQMPMGLEVLAALCGLFYLLNICSSPDCWWLSVLSEWIYLSGSIYSSCLYCLLLVLFGDRSQESCWCCCPTPCCWVNTSGRAGLEDVQEECYSNNISHRLENRLPS